MCKIPSGNMESISFAEAKLFISESQDRKTEHCSKPKDCREQGKSDLDFIQSEDGGDD